MNVSLCFHLLADLISDIFLLRFFFNKYLLLVMSFQFEK